MPEILHNMPIRAIVVNSIWSFCQSVFAVVIGRCRIRLRKLGDNEADFDYSGNASGHEGVSE